jgi:zinc finger CCHC domain-containing protein 9
MTRVTNFGIKRTYVQAGFDAAAVEEKEPVALSEPASDALPAPPPKKKRKRTKMSQRDGNKAKNAAMQEGATEEANSESAPPPAQPPKPAKKSKPKKSARIPSDLCEHRYLYFK